MRTYQYSNVPHQYYEILIKHLMECPSGEEVNVLNDNFPLVNETLLDTIQKQIVSLRASGNHEAANFLDKLTLLVENTLLLLKQSFKECFEHSLSQFEKKRQQEQMQLIQELINCPSEQEINVLNSKPTLLDGALIRMMSEIALELKRQGNIDTGNYLMSLSTQLGEELTQRNRKPYIDFIQKLLTCEEGFERSLLNSNPNLVNPTLVQLMEKRASYVENNDDHKQAILIRRLMYQIDAEIEDNSPYLRFIHDLVNSSDTREQTLINQYSQFIDSKLSLYAVSVAKRMCSYGDTNHAKWLLEKVKKL